MTYTDSSALGGAERALATLVGTLDERIEVTVSGTSREVVERIAARRPGAGLRVVPEVRDKSDLAGISGHLRLMRDVRPAVLHANIWQPWSCRYALGAAMLTRGVRTVAVHHLMPPATDGRAWHRRFTLARVDAHVAVARACAEAVERATGLRMGSVRVIYNGVSDPPVTPRPRVTDGPVVGYVGRLSAEKGVDVLIRAVVALPDVTLILIGDGPDRSRLEGLAGELDIGGRVVLAGWQEDPRPWYKGLDVLALPSRSEALPLAAVEAMLAERPVVASRVGGTREVVLDGLTGILVPPDDHRALGKALAALLGDEARRVRMGRRGREVAGERFGVTRMARAYESLYDELSSRRRRTSRAAPQPSGPHG